jgi:hypothetical protein
MKTFDWATMASSLVVLAACGGPQMTPDAAMDTGTTVSDGATDASDASDSGCPDLTGYFELSGSCAGSDPPHNACVSQTGCNVTMATDDGTFTGTVTAGSAMLTGTTAIGGHATCTGTPTAGSWTFDCDLGDGQPMCSLTGIHNNVPSATRVCCDVTVQDCGSGQRCNLVSVPDPNAVATTACIPAMGALTEGMPCTRMPIGYDDCAPGLYCAGTGSPAGMTRCRALCASDHDCPSGGACVATSAGPAAGFCVPRCDVFSTTCGTGLGCSVAIGHAMPAVDIGVPICQSLGTTALGGACMGNPDCASGFCQGSMRCVTPCNAMHPCALGAACTPINGLEMGMSLGYCPPPA